MGGDLAAGYLDGLPPAQAAELARVNGPGLTALREYLASGAAVAFLGAGVSAPLYPLWAGLIGELVDAAAGRMGEREAATCRALALQSPEEVVELVRRQLGEASYRKVLRQALRARVDAESGRSWTPVQELICRCAFKAVVTTNYDPGIVNARMRVRPDALATGFTTWEDELGLDRGGPGTCSARPSCRFCSRTASTTGPTRWCWRPRSTGGRTRASCRWCWPGCWTGTWPGSGSASPTSGSPRSCGRSPTAPAPGWNRAARRATSP